MTLRHLSVTVDEAMRGFLAFLVLLIFIIGGASALLWLIGYASAHDTWISRGTYKNQAGEWCCGANDCKPYSKAASTPIGWVIDGEIVPFDEALPVAPPDGQVTVCRRPNGTRRCVLGVKPGF